MPKISVLKIKQNILSFLKFVFPSQKIEWIIFLVFFIIYGIIGWYISQNFRIIFNKNIPWDAYFSFDNKAIVMNGGGVERHPLAKYWFDGIRNLALTYSDGKFDAEFRWILALLSNLAISLNIVLVFKYLRNIIHLPILISVSIIAFYGVFFTNIILSFTPETYTYTLLFLVLFNYYATKKLQQNEKISTVPLVFSGVFIGGLTITNLSKVFIPIIFEKKIFQKPKVFFNAIFRGLITIVIFIILFLNRVNFDYKLILNKTEEQYEKFSKLKNVPVWDMISSWFFGGNIFVSSLYTLDYKSKAGFEYKAIFMDVFSNWTLYLATFLVIILIFWSYLVNFKNKLVQIVFLSFVVDIIIHCILKFGLNISYIYGGHFIFVYPILIGWLFYYYRDKTGFTNALFAITILLFSFTLLNNFYRFNELFILLQKFYS